MIMGVIWAGLVALSILAGACNGTLPMVSAAAMSGAAEAVELAISLAGALCLWNGFISVMGKSGIINTISTKMLPLLKKLFPITCKDRAAREQLCANLSANLLGLGNAATPAGIGAVKRMKELSGGDSATDEMCLFIVLNTASVQLFPTTVASVRASLGAEYPLNILPSVWITSLCSVFAGLCAARLLRGRRHG